MKKRSTKQQFIIKDFLKYFLCFTLPTLLLSTVLILAAFVNRSRELDDRIDNSLMLAADTLATITTEITTVDNYFQKSSNLLELSKLMNIDKFIDYNAFVTQKYIFSFISSITYAKPHLESMYVYIANRNNRVCTAGNALMRIERMADKSWVDELQSHRDSRIWVTKRKVKAYDFVEPYDVLSVFKRFHSYNGGMVVNYKSIYLSRMLDNVLYYKNQNILLLGSDGEIILQNSRMPLALAEEIKDAARAGDFPDFIRCGGKKYAIKSLDYPYLYIRIVSMVPQSAIYADISREVKNTVLICLLITVMTVFMSYYSATKSYNQLASIVETLDSAQNQRQLTPVETADGDLYSHILANIIGTFVEKSYLQTQLSERKYKLKTAELMALQYQINPHFLFNTLQTINYEILALSKGQNTQANQMVEQLSDILRFSLDSPDNGVPLFREIENCKKYIAIQQVRYDNRFNVIWDVDDRVLHQQVLRLILQPILENSIQHGIKNKITGGTVKIKIHLSGNRVCFRVIDNGAGMATQRLKQVRRELACSTEQDEIMSAHIGVSNCNQRLVLRYSTKSAIQINSRENIGTVVSFFIPNE